MENLVGAFNLHIITLVFLNKKHPMTAVVLGAREVLIAVVDVEFGLRIC